MSTFGSGKLIILSQLKTPSFGGLVYFNLQKTSTVDARVFLQVGCFMI